MFLQKKSQGIKQYDLCQTKISVEVHGTESSSKILPEN